MNDQLLRYLFERGTVRVQAVALADTWRNIAADRNYPAPVRSVLGELTAAAALLSASLKFNGALVLQLFGDGPLRLAVAECQADLTLRSAATCDRDAIADDQRFAHLANEHGRGKFSIVLDPKDRQPGQQPYQGIVPLTGDSVADALQHYMLTSEQVDSRLWLAADEERAVGLLLQRMPAEGVGEDAAQEDWQRAVTLADTIQREELLTLDPNEWIKRLFWEETLRMFEPRMTRFACTCSRDKVANMLRTLGSDEVTSIITERGNVDVACEYCGRKYVFDRVDAEALFRESFGYSSRERH